MTPSPALRAATKAQGGAALLINARARSGARAEALAVEALRSHGLQLDEVVHVRHPAQLHDSVEALVKQGMARIIIGGGDGTLSSVVPQFVARDVLLGILPLGTANDLARTLGISSDLTQAAQVAAGDHVERIDLATANGVPFLNVASVGLSVATTARVSARMKRWLGPAAYALAGAIEFVSHVPFIAAIDSTGEPVAQTVHQLIVGNGRFFGGGVLVAQGSTLHDGSLSVYTLGARGRMHLLRTMVLLRLQVPLHHPGDSFTESLRVVVATHPAGLPVNLDGEIRTQTPVVFTVNPGAVRVLAPRPAEA